MERFPKKGKARALQVTADVLNPKTLDQAHESIKADFAAADILINTAGGNHPSATTSNELYFLGLWNDYGLWG